MKEAGAMRDADMACSLVMTDDKYCDNDNESGARNDRHELC